MAEKINVGKFINNLDSEDLSSEKLQGVVGNVYAKAIRDHKTTAKKAEDNLKDKDKETVEFTKSNHDRLKAHKNKPEKDLNKDNAPVEDKVVKDINESVEDEIAEKQKQMHKIAKRLDDMTAKNPDAEHTLKFRRLEADMESLAFEIEELKSKSVEESKKQRSPFRKVNESHDCKRNYKNVRFASQEIEKKGYSHAEANDIALKLFDNIEGDTQRSLEWHLEKILPKEEFDKENHKNESLTEDIEKNRKLVPGDTIVVRGTKAVIKDILSQDVFGTDIYIEFIDDKGNYRNWKSSLDGGTVIYKESLTKDVAESNKLTKGKKLTEAKTFQPMTLREYGKKFLDGYLDTDVYDTEIDMGVAFVFDCDEEPTDNYEKFLSILADNVVVKDAFNDGDLTCDFSGFYKPYNDKINDWYRKNGGHQEFEGEEGYYDLVLATEGLVSGSYSEEDYKELCDIFKTKVESKNIVEAPIPRNATKIKVGGKEFTKEKDWVDGNRVHVSPKDIKRLYGNDVEVLETDPNYKSKRTKEVKVLQGNYGYGWDDLVEYDKEDSAELKQDLRSYRENERNARFRVITRRIPLGEDKLTEAKSSKKLIYTIGDRFVAHQLDGVTSPFNREFDAAKKYRDVSNDPNFKHGSIGCKGKSYKSGVNQWVKDVEPTEFMVWTKKENPSWKDDVLDVYYRKETVNESKKLTEGKKIDLYVNGEYVCSSTRYKKVKDFVDAVKKDGKVTYAGLDNNGKLSDKVTKTIKDTDKVVGRIVTESKKLKEERRSRKALADENLDFEYTVRDAQGNVINGFSTKRERQ